MTSYRIVFKRSAEKELRRLPKRVLTRIAERMERLSDDPHPRLTIQYVRHRRDAYRDL